MATPKTFAEVLALDDDVLLSTQADVVAEALLHDSMRRLGEDPDTWDPHEALDADWIKIQVMVTTQVTLNAQAALLDGILKTLPEDQRRAATARAGRLYRVLLQMTQKGVGL